MIKPRIEGISRVEETIAGPAFGRSKKIFLWKGGGGRTKGKGWPVRLVQEKSCFPVGRFSAGDAELVLVNLHLVAYDEGEGRLAQTQVLFDFLLAEYAKGNYCVAGGDFNRNFPGAEDNFPVKDRACRDPVVLAPALPGEGWIFASDTGTPGSAILIFKKTTSQIGNMCMKKQTIYRIEPAMPLFLGFFPCEKFSK